jgi:integrase
MPRTSTTRAAQGSGTIRQRKDGRWEARYTVGRDPGTGRQIQRYIYGESEKEVLKELQAVQVDLTNGTYTEPSKMTVSAWLDFWTANHLGNIKESTQASYKGHIKNHISPAIGAVKLQKLTPDTVQNFYGNLTKKGLSAKTVKNIHGVLNAAMAQALEDDKIKKNPCHNRTLPRITKKEIVAMDSTTVTAFLKAINGHQFEALYFVDLFSGMRQAEILGLSWKAINFEQGTIRIDRQLVKSKLDGRYFIDTTKHDKIRTITPALIVMEKLRQHKSNQAARQLKAGQDWNNCFNLVFTDDFGKHLVHHTVRQQFKRIAAIIGQPELTFHGLRHSFAVLSLMNGDDAKTVQNALGHHTAAFTLDTYGHSTNEMQRASAQRMEAFIQRVTAST